MTVFPKLFSNRPNRATRRGMRRVEHRIPFDPTIELEVGMMRYYAYANSTTYVDLTASNRQIVFIDVTKFVSPTFCFEAVLRAPATNNISYARLYNITDAVAVAGSEVSASELDWTRKRSGSISLSGSKQYKVQIRNTTASGLVIIAQARIIIVDAATTLTTVEHQIELGRGSTTSTTMVELARPGRYLFEAENFEGTLTVYFEVTGYVSAYTGEFELYNLTDAASVSGSLLQTTSTSPVRLRSGAITLTSGKEYTVRLRNTKGKETALGGGRIVIVQTKADGITKMQVIKAVGEHESTISTSYVNLSQQALLDTANFVGFQLSYCYEAVICTEAAAYPAYSALRNLTDTTMVSDSELSTASTTNVRLRSGSISLESTKEYVGAIHGSGGYYCYHSIARIIIDLAPPPPPVLFAGGLNPQLAAKIILGL